MRIHEACLWVALAAGWCGAAAAVERENLRFYLPFEGDLQPRVAGANTQLKFVKGTEPEAQLVEGRRGQGLKATPKFSLQYSTRESFTAKEGTLAFWMKPVGWSGVNCHRYFLIAGADQVNLHFYIYYGNPWFYVAGSKRYDLVGSPNWQFAFEKDPFPEGQWIFLAATYKPGQQAFYINDQLIIRRSDGLIEPEFSQKGTIEIPPGDQVLDEIMLFDRALTGPEINALYQANTPNSK